MKILYLDIETTPNLCFVWNLYRPYISPDMVAEVTQVLCWAAKWNGGKMQFSSRRDKTQKQMIHEIWKLLDEADAVVHYNGKRFDVPRLNQEFQKYGFGPPSPYKQIDLYKVVKKQFALPSNKLDFVVQYFDLGKKVKHAGMELWIGCMSDDARCWRKMESYNKRDVRLNEKLYKFLLPWIDGHPNSGLYDNHDGCVVCGGKLQKRGFAYTKCMVYQNYWCTKCGKWQRGKTSITPKGVGTMRG